MKKILCLMLIFLLITVSCFMFGCKNSNEKLYLSYNFDRTLTYCCDMALDPIYGLESVTIPYSSIYCKTLIDGKGLYDMYHRLLGYKEFYPWQVFDKGKIGVGSLTLSLIPKSNFDKNMSTRTITHIGLSDTKVAVDMRLHTINESEIQDQCFFVKRNQTALFNSNGETSIEFPVNFLDSWRELKKEICIKKVEFLYGNLKFGECVKIKFNDENKKSIDISDPNNADCKIKDDLFFSVLIDIEAVDNAKEVLADTLIIEVVIMDNPVTSYRVYSNSVVFLNKRSV